MLTLEEKLEFWYNVESQCHKIRMSMAVKTRRRPRLNVFPPHDVLDVDVKNVNTTLPMSNMLHQSLGMFTRTSCLRTSLIKPILVLPSCVIRSMATIRSSAPHEQRTAAEPRENQVEPVILANIREVNDSIRLLRLSAADPNHTIRVRCVTSFAK